MQNVRAIVVDRLREKVWGDVQDGVKFGKVVKQVSKVKPADTDVAPYWEIAKALLMDNWCDEW